MFSFFHLNQKLVLNTRRERVLDHWCFVVHMLRILQILMHKYAFKQPRNRQLLGRINPISVYYYYSIVVGT